MLQKANFQTAKIYTTSAQNRVDVTSANGFDKEFIPISKHLPANTRENVTTFYFNPRSFLGWGF